MRSLVSKPADALSVTDLPLAAPFTVRTSWQLLPRLCEHCGKPVGEHSTRASGTDLLFVCGENVIHTRPGR
jgi:hypothetical protein